MSFNASSDTGITAIENVLIQEANRIGKDIFKATLHTSPWVDLIRQTTFPEGMGYSMTSLVYERAIPTTATSGNTPGVNWHKIGIVESANTFSPANSPLAAGRNALADATKQLAGPSGGDQNEDGAMDSSDGNSGDVRSFVNFGRKLRQYTLSRGVIESPKINLEDLRFAAHRAEQLRAIMEALTESTKWAWEHRYRDEYERISANFVPCLTASTPILTTVDGDTDNTADDLFEGLNLTDLDPVYSGSGNSDVTPTANISNKILDKIQQRLIRSGAGTKAYGRENGRPIFCLVCSSEASYQLQTESGFRDDVRYDKSRVSELLAPLGVEKSYRGFYHLIDDVAPRFSISGSTITRVLPHTTSGGIVSDNASYDTADYEAAYVLHADVMESQIPAPFSGMNGMTFDPVTYRGEYKWSNIKHAVTNPDGTIGYYRGILASASRPIRPEYGYVVLFKRSVTTPAA